VATRRQSLNLIYPPKRPLHVVRPVSIGPLTPSAPPKIRPALETDRVGASLRSGHAELRAFDVNLTLAGRTTT
jgi:hypothetical protein